VRRQREAATALWFTSDKLTLTVQSGVALRLPPHSKQTKSLNHLFSIETMVQAFSALDVFAFTR
jgi:hypothetical protein